MYNIVVIESFKAFNTGVKGDKGNLFRRVSEDMVGFKLRRGGNSNLMFIIVIIVFIDRNASFLIKVSLHIAWF